MIEEVEVLVDVIMIFCVATTVTVLTTVSTSENHSVVSQTTVEVSLSLSLSLNLDGRSCCCSFLVYPSLEYNFTSVISEQFALNQMMLSASSLWCVFGFGEKIGRQRFDYCTVRASVIRRSSRRRCLALGLIRD